MTELDAERRDQIALTLFDLGLDTAEDWWNRQADALAPLVAAWLAEAWDAGWDARHESYWSGDQNPYRDTPSKDGEDE